MIEHNLFEMENYRELIDEVGVDKFRERFEELQKTAMEFIEMAGFSETSYCNERILMQVILDYFMDVMRLKEFHSIERMSDVWNETFCTGCLCGKISRIYRNAAILFQIPSVRSKDIRTFDRII